eukprot:7377207-Alexandrium_andersonii.AAC.1
MISQVLDTKDADELDVLKREATEKLNLLSQVRQAAKTGLNDLISAEAQASKRATRESDREAKA